MLNEQKLNYNSLMVLTTASFTLSVSFSSMIWLHSLSEISSVSFTRTFDNFNSSFTFFSRITLGFMQKKCSSVFCSEWNRVFSWLVVMSITVLNTSTWKRFSPDSSLESLESSSKNFLTWVWHSGYLPSPGIHNWSDVMSWPLHAGSFPRHTWAMH